MWISFGVWLFQDFVGASRLNGNELALALVKREMLLIDIVAPQLSPKYRY